MKSSPFSPLSVPGIPAPDLEALSHYTPATPPTGGNTSFDDDDDLLHFNVYQLLEEAAQGKADETAGSEENPYNDRKFSIVFDTERRRSSGVAVQHLLSQLDGVDMDQVFRDCLSPSAFADDCGSFDSSPAWKVVVETAFMPKYYRNDRKNVQCFPVCTLGSQRNGTDTAAGHGKSTTWCRGTVNARAFAIDPETNIADLSMFEAFGAFVMNADGPKTKPLDSIPDKIRGSIRKVDGRSFEIKIAPTVWKFEPPLSKKKSEENRNQCYFVVVICFRGREVGRCVSPPFDIGSQKAEIRKKRAIASDDAHWEPKHLVLDTFAQASYWAMATIGMRSPKPEMKKAAVDEKAAETDQDESVDIVEAGLRQPADNAKAAAIPAYPVADLASSSPVVETATAVVVPRPEAIAAGIVDTKRVSLALLLWLPPFGLLGAHHAYLGRLFHAKVTLLTFNLLLVGWVLDAFRLPMLVHDANLSASKSPEAQFMSALEYSLIWLIFGILGGHRYVTGDYAYGLLFTITLGGFGILWLSDGLRLGKLYVDAKKSYETPVRRS